MARGSLIGRTGCPFCGSSDAGAMYSNNTWYCFSCEKKQKGNPNKKQSTSKKKTKGKRGSAPLAITYESISNRGITEKTCSAYRYGIGEANDKEVHVAQYFDNTGAILGQKLRYPDKTFAWQGSAQKTLWGKHATTNEHKVLVITEGEIDALSVAQSLDFKVSVVSVPNGAQSSDIAIRQDISYVNAFEKVILWFDNDEKGQNAIQKVAGLIAPGKLYITTSEAKDANELLVNKGKVAIVKAIRASSLYRPDGVLSGNTVRKRMMTLYTKGLPSGWSVPYKELNSKLRGIHKKRLYMFTAGSGVGKSTILANIAYSLMMQHTLKIGYIALEESVEETMLRLLSIHIGKNIKLDPKKASKVEYTEALDTLIKDDRLVIYNHFGSLDSDNLVEKITYMVTGLGCDIIVLDHISIVVSGESLSSDERRIIDRLMTNLRSTIEQTGATILAVTHLRRKGSDNKGHSEGAIPKLGEMRGSGSIEQISDVVIAMARDTMEESNNITTLYVLKNRIVGLNGYAGKVKYNLEEESIRHYDEYDEETEF